MKTEHTLAHSLFQREKIVFTLIGLSLIFGTYYAVLISQTVLNAVKERAAQALIQELQKDIAELELAYIENENSLNMDYAYALGFKDVESRQFVTRATNLTLR
ncbi:MAG: hypothetical protein WDZ74_01645 [Candidatus Paceibacterota bacterium]